MEMCLLLFKSAQPVTMQNIANLDIALIAQLWMPLEFVGDYITQRLCLKLIVAVLKHLSVEERQTQVSKVKLDSSIENLILKLSADPTNFEKVSRELLNVYNMTFSRNCTVFSIYCTKALFGSSELFKPDGVNNFWIDFNYTSKCVSLLCKLDQSEIKQEEFYIKIKINKLQIENQFDCSVYTIERASFSTSVSAQLLSSRVAVFTLPKNELERLKANSDLIDYYNAFSYCESSQVSTPNTIVKYLAELSEDSPQTPYSEHSFEMPKMKLPRIKLHKYDAVQKDMRKDSTKSQNVNLAFENKSTANNTSLVSHVEYLPNYVGPSINTGVNATTTQDTIIFKKPNIPIQFKKKKHVQTKKMQNTSEEKPEGPKTWPNKNRNKHQRRFIESTYSKNRTVVPPIINKEQQHSSPMPIYKSGREQMQVKRRNVSREEISFAFTSIQVSRNSFQGLSNPTKQPVKEKQFQNIRQKLIEENSLLEMSLQEMVTASRSAINQLNEEKIIQTSSEACNVALVQPGSSENVPKLHSNQCEAPENPTNSSEIPIHSSGKMTQSAQLSNCLDILEDQNPSTQTSCAYPSQEISNNSNFNRSPIINQCTDTLQYRDGENQVTSSQTSNEELHTSFPNVIPSELPSKQSQIVKNENSSILNGLNMKTNSLEDIASELPKETSRRFFKHKKLPTICPTTTTKAKPKPRKKKTVATESHPKTKNINLVKPLNYMSGINLNINKPVSESRENENSQITNVVQSEDKVSYLFKENGDTYHVYMPKSFNRRTSKQKTLLKQVEVSNFVPYSIWKNNQKEKNDCEPIMLSRSPKQHKEIPSETEAKQPSTDPFDKVKHFGFENESITRFQKYFGPKSRRRRSSSSNSIHTYYFSESENETESAQDICFVKNKPRYSLCKEIVRREQSDELIQSPIPVPFEIAERKTKSPSRESILTPTKIPLALDCHEVLISPQQPSESNPVLTNRTICSVSPVYEDLDEELPEDPPEGNTCQPPKMYNLHIEEHTNVSPTKIRLSSSENENQGLPDIRPSLESNDNNFESELVQLLPTKLQLIDKLVEKPTSSQGSPISICSEAETNEQEAHRNEIISRNHHVVDSLRKRTHSGEKEDASLAKIPALNHCTPLKDYDRLLPDFIKKLTTEKDRLLNNIKIKFNEDVFDSFNKTVEEVTKLIYHHETAIKGEQEKLSTILENLESHHKVLKKNQSQLEEIHGKITQLTQILNYKTDKIDEIYKEAEEVLVSYADVIRKEQWHSFSEGIINSVNERLRGYLDI